YQCRCGGAPCREATGSRAARAAAACNLSISFPPVMRVAMPAAQEGNTLYRSAALRCESFHKHASRNGVSIAARTLGRLQGIQAMSKPSGFFLALILSLTAPGARAAGPPSVAPEGPVWGAGAGFQFADKPDKKRESVSGIACPTVSSSPRRCIVAFDEGGEE